MLRFVFVASAIRFLRYSVALTYGREEERQRTIKAQQRTLLSLLSSWRRRPDTRSAGSAAMKTLLRGEGSSTRTGVRPPLLTLRAGGLAAADAAHAAPMLRTQPQRRQLGSVTHCFI